MVRASDNGGIVNAARLELYVKHSILANGYDTKEVPEEYKVFGADFLFEYNGSIFTAKCEYTEEAVGIEAVQAVVAANGFFNTDYACLFSRSGFSDEAWMLALANHVLLVDWFSLTKKSIEETLAEFILEQSESKVEFQSEDEPKKPVKITRNYETMRHRHDEKFEQQLRYEESRNDYDEEDEGYDEEDEEGEEDTPDVFTSAMYVVAVLLAMVAVVLFVALL